MPKKPKFEPEIRKVKLNHEQAVLACSCFDIGRLPGGSWFDSDGAACMGGKSSGTAWCSTVQHLVSS
jgi:hypothetical protein